MIKIKFTKAMLSGILCLGLGTPLCAAPLYRATPLPAMPTYETEEGRFTALAMNDSGQAAGYWSYKFQQPGTFLPSTIRSDGIVVEHYYSSSYQAALLDHGELKLLGSVGLPDSKATFINDAGQVAGEASKRIVNAPADFSPVSVTHAESKAFLYANGAAVDLGTLGGTAVSAFGLNASGQVLGNANREAAGVQAFIYTNGQMVSLSGQQTSVGRAINDSGMATGEVWLDNTPGSQRAFAYQDGQLITIDTGEFRSIGQAISSDGRVAGYIDMGSQHEFGMDREVFVYQNGALEVIGGLPSPNGTIFGEAVGINARGEVLGLSTSDPYGGWIYTGGQVHDLNDVVLQPEGDPISFGHPVSIDDAGRIIVQVEREEVHRYLLTPIPEPTSASLMGLGLLGVLLVAGRRRR